MADTKPRKIVKSKPSKKPLDNIIIVKTEKVLVSKLKFYPKNPRIGNVDAIAESLRVNGQFKTIVVNLRNMEVLAGNHTLKAARQNKMEYLVANFVDVDDEAAKLIVLADNRTSDEGKYDQPILMELVVSLKSLEGSGYNASDVDDMMKEMEEESGKTLGDFRDLMPDDLGLGEKKKDPRQQILDDEDEDDAEVATKRGATRKNLDKDEEVNELEDLEDVQTELQALLEMREDNVFDSDDFWNIPMLRRDMLVDKLPDNLGTWGGHEATPDRGDNWFLWNYGLGGIKGLPFDRSILSFFTFDWRFSNFWELPAYYISKVISSGCKIAVCPDFSFYDEVPRVVHLQGVYQSQWLGRFFQESGMKVIPRIQFMDAESLKFCLLGIPKNPPVVAVSVQNIPKEKEGNMKETKLIIDVLQKAIDKVEPTNQVLIYGGKPAQRIMGQLDLHGAEGVWIENYSGVRRGSAYDKKDGMSQLTQTQKKKIRNKVQQDEADRLGIEVSDLKVNRRGEDEEDE